MPVNDARKPPFRSFLSLIIVLFCCGCKPGASRPGHETPDETEQLRRRYVELRRQEQALAAEYTLAKNSEPYLIVDLASRNLRLKARGRDLRNAGIVDSSDSAGGGASSMVWAMTDRNPLEEFERPKIAPGAGEDAAAEAAKKALWGPDRMPADYDLICEGDNVLQIRSLPDERSHNRVLIWIVSTYRRSADWFRQWRAPKYARPLHSVQLWLTEDDSRLVFWSLPKRVRILILRMPALP